MPVQLSDVVSITSVGLAFSALGVAIDSVMVPRLEKFRDHLFDLAEKTRTESAPVIQELVPGRDDYLINHLKPLDAILDDLRAKRFFHELSCKLFLNGSIVRALLTTMVAEALILVLSVTLSASVPLLPNAAKNMLNYFPSECPPSQRYFCDGSHSWLAILSCLIIVYLSVCMFQYVRLWKKEQESLLRFETALGQAKGALSMYFRFKEH